MDEVKTKLLAQAEILRLESEKESKKAVRKHSKVVTQRQDSPEEITMQT